MKILKAVLLTVVFLARLCAQTQTQYGPNPPWPKYPSAPAHCNVAEQYYDTTTNKVRTCIATDTWSDTGSGVKVLSVQHSTTDSLIAATINTTETAFAATYSVPANYFINNKTLRVWVTMEFTTSAATAPTQRLRVRLGGLTGTVMFDSTAFSPGGSQVSRTGTLMFTLIGTAAPGASVGVETGVLGSANPVNVITVDNTIAQPVNVATNASQVLALTLQYGTNTAGNVTVLRQMIVEELN